MIYFLMALDTTAGRGFCFVFLLLLPIVDGEKKSFGII